MVARLRRRMALVALFRLLRPDGPGVGRRLAAIPRMIRATRRREYDGAGRLGLMVFAAIHVVSPLDFLGSTADLVGGLRP
jgi:hypothetical protein